MSGSRRTWRASRRLASLGTLALLLAACGASSPATKSVSTEPPAKRAVSSETAVAVEGDGARRERALDEVAAIHGAPGPWAVSGYRMSEYALEKLGLPRGSFDLQVVHWTPREIRYSCIADGAAAHSGASLGKLNLSLVDTTPENVLTVYRNKKSGKSIALRPSASFRQRFADTPRERARELGREVLELPAELVFEEIETK